MTLTPMQREAHSLIADGRNLLLLSPTGSGKTLAFLLPVITRLKSGGGLQTVVIVPSRELAQQIDGVFKEQVRQQQLTLRSMALYGGRPTMDEHRTLREVQPEIIFATPGRFLDHLGKDNISLLRVRTLVLDEYDKCLELGFRDEMDSIAAATPRHCQVVLTSATRTEETARILDGRTFATIDYLDTTTLAHRISHYRVTSPESDKLDTLTRLLTHLGTEQSIVFTAFRDSAERIARYLREAHFPVALYHGGLEQDQRERALYRFRAGAATTLVSTDLAARGLDIPDVRHIVHYILPIDADVFTHRIGRTARWEQTGASYCIVGRDEALPEFVPDEVEELEVADVTVRAPQAQWTLLYIGRGKRDKLSRADVLGFLCKKGGLRADQIGRIDLAPHAAYVAVAPKAVKPMLQQIAGEKIKGMRTIIEPLRH